MFVYEDNTTNTAPQVVISPKNFFLFTPLLPSVAVGTLNPRSIIQPTRYITRHKTRTVSVIEADAQEVDVRLSLSIAARRILHFSTSPSIKPSLSQVSYLDAHARDYVKTSRSDSSEIKGDVSSTTIPYDYLVFAVGAEVQTFGIPGVKENACFMKELADAEKVSFLPRFARVLTDLLISDAKAIHGL